MNYEIMGMIKSKFSSDLTIFSRLALKKIKIHKTEELRQ